MTKTTKICDFCGRETQHLYIFPRIEIEGLNVSIYPNGHELCGKCAVDFKNHYKNYRGEQNEPK